MFTPNTPHPHHRPHPLAVATSLLLALAAPLAQAAYTVNADGTVTDTTTGLVWDRCVLGRSTTTTACDTGSAATYNWADALAQVVARNTASHLGFADWRLPNVNELESLVSLEQVSPAIDTTAFPNTPTSNSTPHATATTEAATPAAAWGVEFGYGEVQQVSGAKTGSTLSYVRMVRSGPTAAAFDALPPANGACGSAHATTPLVTTAPSGGALCTTGTAGSVTDGNTAYTWTCAGGNGGSPSGTCSASRGYTVTPSAGANGSLNPSTPQVVAYLATSAFTVAANGGYAVNTVTGCGGALSGSTYTTGAVTATCTVTASFTSVSPPPEPPAPPPPPPVVDQGSNLTLSGGPFDVRANAVIGSVLTITGPTGLQLANGGGLLHAQPEPTGTTARLAFVAGPGGVPVPRLLSGRARFTATTNGQSLLGWLQTQPSANTVVLNAGSCTGTPTELLAEVNESTGQTLLTVLGCQVSLPVGLPLPNTRQVAAQSRVNVVPTTTATPTAAVAPAILPGEYVVLNAQGQVQEMGLGSATGDQGLTGDAVARTATTGLVWMHTRPNLQGKSQRLDGDVAQTVANWLTTHQGYGEVIQPPQNGVLIARQDGKRVVLGALGRVRVDPASTQPDGWQAQGQGAYTLNLKGLGMTWAPTLVNTEGFARLLAEHGGSTVVQADGTLLVTLGGSHYAAQAGEQLEPATSTGGLALTPQGVLTFNGTLFGYPQTLYPAAADFAGLRTAVLAADAQGTALGLGQGRIKVVLGGQTYTLKPDLALVPVPAQHAGKTVWLEGQPIRLYLPVGGLPGFAQGFAVE